MTEITDEQWHKLSKDYLQNHGKESTLDEYEQREKRKIAKAEAEAQANKDSAALAETFLNGASIECDNHPYLQKRQVKACPGLRITTKQLTHPKKQIIPTGSLLIPVKNSRGEISSLQFITPQLEKKNLINGKMSGCFFTIPGKGRTVICEGYATGMSINMSTGLPVVIAFSSGNIKNIAELEAYKNAFIAADRDAAGEASAEATGKSCLMPKFESYDGNPKDFNDLHAREGIDAVKTQFDVFLDKSPFSSLEKQINDATEKREYLRLQSEVQKANLEDFAKEMLWNLLAEKSGIDVKYLRPKIKRKKAQPQNAKEKIEELNKEYGLIRIGGETKILRTYRNLMTDSIEFDAMSLQSFKNWFIGEEIDGENIADIYLKSTAKNKYANGIVFEPAPYGKEPDPKYKNCFNTWTGLAIEPKKGDWTRIEEHIFLVICNGNEKHYDWLLDWCAYVLQNIGRKRPRTALVLQGGQGIGKTSFAKIFEKIFGRKHYIEITNPDQLTGRFNFMLMDKIFIYANEAFFAGNKKDASNLKAQITEEYRTIEKKYVDGFSVRNHSVYLFDSNSDRVINAERDDRRYFVLKVSESCKDKKNYWNELKEQIDNGEAEAFLYDMLYRKITNDIHKTPKTDALKEQKIESFDLFTNWWIIILEAGEFEFFGNTFDSESLFKKYEEYEQIKKHSTDRAKPKLSISRRIKKIHQSFKSHDQTTNAEGRRYRPWTLPDIEIARSDFDAHISHNLQW